MKTIYQAIVLLLIFSTFCFAEQKEFTQTVKYIMGENESRQELRELATLEAKHRILEQVGVYIESTTELKQTITENNTKLLDESEFSKEIIAITAGVTNTTIDKEEWKDEDGVFVLYLTCRISVDTEDVNSKIQALVKDREKLADVKVHQDENARLQFEIVELRNQLELAKTTQIKGIKLKRQVLSSEYSAAEWYNKGLKTDNIDKRIEYYTHSINQNPDWLNPYVNRGNAYASKDDYKSALSDHTKAIQIDQNSLSALRSRGFVYHLSGNYDSALADYELALKIDSNDAITYFMRGQTNNLLGEFERALIDFNKAIQLGLNIHSLYYSRGNAYLLKGDSDRALVDYNRAIEINPNDYSTFHNRGLIYNSVGRYDLAIRDYSEAIDINPKLSSIYHHRGSTYARILDYNSAISDYNKAIQLLMNTPAKEIESESVSLESVYISRGILYESKGEHKLALIDYNKAIKINPTHAIAFYMRGKVSFTITNDYDSAINDFNKTIQLLLEIPSDDVELKDVYIICGLAYAMLEDNSNAIISLRRAKGLGRTDAQHWIDQLR